MAQEKIRKPAPQETEAVEEEETKDLTPTADKAKKAADEAVDEIDAALKENEESKSSDLDGLMDEIDEVLEENAEEFVKNYVQRGGE